MKPTPRADADEIIKSARRRARAADSRRRALIGSSAEPVTDGSLALSPSVAPIEIDEPEPIETEPPARGRQRRTVTIGRPDDGAVPEPVPMARTPFIAMMLSLVVAGIVGLLLLNTVINENAFQLQELHDQQSALDSQEQRLTDELAQLSAPGNLAAMAERLGMVPAEEVTFIRLQDGKEMPMN